VANTAVSWPGRLRQIHSFFRGRSPDQMLATAAPWTSPWLPPGYEQNLWNGALDDADGCPGCHGTAQDIIDGGLLTGRAEIVGKEERAGFGEKVRSLGHAGPG
jgi:hypothetical protein